jgi:hypothetical protein
VKEKGSKRKKKGKIEVTRINKCQRTKARHKGYMRKKIFANCKRGKI